MPSSAASDVYKRQTLPMSRATFLSSSLSSAEADSCFARVVGGFDVVERMRKQPAPKGMGFINDPAGYVVIDDIFLKDA